MALVLTDIEEEEETKRKICFNSIEKHKGTIIIFVLSIILITVLVVLIIQLSLANKEKTNLKSDLNVLKEKYQKLNQENQDNKGIISTMKSLLNSPSNCIYAQYKVDHAGRYHIYDKSAETDIIIDQIIINGEIQDSQGYSQYLEEGNSDVILVLGKRSRNLNCLFYEVKKLVSIDLRNLDTSLLEDVNSMFRYSSNLERINFGKFNTSLVTDMGVMFQDASSITSLDLSSFNTYNVKDFMYMFSGMSSLKYLDIRNFELIKNFQLDGIFYDIPNGKDFLLLVDSRKRNQQIIIEEVSYERYDWTIIDFKNLS